LRIAHRASTLADGALRHAVAGVRRLLGGDLTDVVPAVSPDAVDQLKFSDRWPAVMVASTSVEQSADRLGAGSIFRPPNS
jgi:hypothetical protein